MRRLRMWLFQYWNWFAAPYGSGVYFLLYAIAVLGHEPWTRQLMIGAAVCGATFSQLAVERRPEHWQYG